MKQSAGILLFRASSRKYEVLLVHPGGPFWEHKDKWSIPKGEVIEGEDHLTAAMREFQEEIGIASPTTNLLELGFIKDGAKTNYIWASQGAVNLDHFISNSFSMEWPPHSGLQTEFLENDKARWFELTVAKHKLFKGQVGFIDRLAIALGVQLDELQPPEDPQLTLFAL